MSGWKPGMTAEERQNYLDDEVSVAIRHAMVDKRLQYEYEAAYLVGMKPSTFKNKMAHGKWTHAELCRVVRALGIQPEAVLRMIGVGIK